MRSAFPGAISTRSGRFELAEGGTLFLDEVGELAPETQARLLRVLENGEFERVGAGRSRKVDLRLIAATDRQLERAVRDGSFRADLYYRLSAFPIALRPLRERPEDIPLLVWELIHRRQHELGRRIENVPENGLQELCRYSWPGNIRELSNVIERALILSPGGDLQLDSFIASQAPLPETSERAEVTELEHAIADDPTGDCLPLEDLDSADRDELTAPIHLRGQGAHLRDVPPHFSWRSEQGA